MPTFFQKRNLFVTFLVIVFLIVAMTSFSFPDLFSMYFVPAKIFQYNIYSWVPIYTKTCLWVSATWPPLYYFTIGSYITALSYLHLINPILFSHSCPVFELILNKSFLFWAKFPFLLLHIASAMLFANLFTKRKYLWFLFWLLNPVAIFINFFEGQFDSIPTFFLIAAFYLAHKKSNYFLISLALGIGGAYKHYPFLLILPFAIILETSFWKRIIFLITSIIPYVFFAAFVFNKDYLTSLRFGENYTMLHSGITFGGITISYYIILYFLVLTKLIFDKSRNEYSLYSYSFLFSVIYFITSTWFVQRLLFLIPSLLLLATKSRNKLLFKILPFFYLLYFIYVIFMYPGLFDHTLLLPIFSFIHPINYNISFLSQIQFLIKACMTLSLSFFAFLALTSRKDLQEYEITKTDIVSILIPLFCYLCIIAGFGILTNSFTSLRIF